MDGQVLLAQVTRNGWVESVHAGHAVLVDPDGVVVRSWGRPEDPVLPRSSNKPLQAAGMVGAGLDLAGAQLAIAAASHSGEAFHLDTVRAVLAERRADGGRSGEHPGAALCPRGPDRLDPRRGRSHVTDPELLRQARGHAAHRARAGRIADRLRGP